MTIIRPSYKHAKKRPEKNIFLLYSEQMAIAGLKNLCTPSYVYLVISIIALFAMGMQNFGNANLYCLGAYNCNVYSTIVIFIIKFVYILFWTWILNLMCRAGAGSLAWFFVLFPFILMFVLIGLLFVYNV